jgi:hypothetical protein
MDERFAALNERFNQLDEKVIAMERKQEITNEETEKKLQALQAAIENTNGSSAAQDAWLKTAQELRLSMEEMKNSLNEMHAFRQDILAKQDDSESSSLSNDLELLQRRVRLLTGRLDQMKLMLLQYLSHAIDRTSRIVSQSVSEGGGGEETIPPHESDDESPVRGSAVAKYALASTPALSLEVLKEHQHAVYASMQDESTQVADINALSRSELQQTLAALQSQVEDLSTRVALITGSQLPLPSIHTSTPPITATPQRSLLLSEEDPLMVELLARLSWVEHAIAEVQLTRASADTSASTDTDTDKGAPSLTQVELQEAMSRMQGHMDQKLSSLLDMLHGMENATPPRRGGLGVGGGKDPSATEMTLPDIVQVLDSKADRQTVTALQRTLHALQNESPIRQRPTGEAEAEAEAGEEEALFRAKWEKAQAAVESEVSGKASVQQLNSLQHQLMQMLKTKPDRVEVECTFTEQENALRELREEIIEKVGKAELQKLEQSLRRKALASGGDGSISSDQLSAAARVHFRCLCCDKTLLQMGKTRGPTAVTTTFPSNGTAVPNHIFNRKRREFDMRLNARVHGDDVIPHSPSTPRSAPHSAGSRSGGGRKAYAASPRPGTGSSPVPPSIPASSKQWYCGTCEE